MWLPVGEGGSRINNGRGSIKVRCRDGVSSRLTYVFQTKWNGGSGQGSVTAFLCYFIAFLHAAPWLSPQSDSSLVLTLSSNYELLSTALLPKSAMFYLFYSFDPFFSFQDSFFNAQMSRSMTVFPKGLQWLPRLSSAWFSNLISFNPQTVLQEKLSPPSIFVLTSKPG